MGVIGRQGAKLTIVNFLGVGVGVLSTLFLYPKDPALYGLIMFVIATGSLFEPLASMGIQVIVLRYFSRLKTDHQSDNGLFAYALLHLSLGIVFFGGLFWLFSDFALNLIKQLNPKDFKNIDLFFNFIPVLVGL